MTEGSAAGSSSGEIPPGDFLKSEWAGRLLDRPAETGVRVPDGPRFCGGGNGGCRAAASRWSTSDPGITVAPMQAGLDVLDAVDPEDRPAAAGGRPGTTMLLAW